MKLKFYEKKVKILEKMIEIPIIGLIVAVFCIFFLSDVIVSFIIIGVSVMVLFLFVIMLIYAEEDLVREKVNYYLKENEYTEIFLKINRELISKIAYDIVKENDLIFLAKKAGSNIVVNVVKEDTELLSFVFDNYDEFFDYFSLEEV